MLATAVLCGCDKNVESDYPGTNTLDVPSVTVSGVSENSAVISWSAVANATSYIYSMDGGPEDSTENTSVTLNDLTPEQSYTIRVRAQKAGSLYFADSDYAEASFETTSHVAVYRIATFADDWDKWYYEYDDAGLPKRVYRMYDGAVEKEWIFTYSGESLQISGSNNYSITLNGQGYVASLNDGSDDYSYTYDDDGYLVKVERNGDIYSNIVIENGNIVSWSKFDDGTEHLKMHTYSDIPNTGGSHCIYSERAGAGRWLVETGLFGKASAYIHAASQWDYSSSATPYEFKYDDKGCISQEIKSPDDWAENFYYTYDVL